MNRFLPLVLLLPLVGIRGISAQAQNTPDSTKARHRADLSPVQWKAVEGYFRSTKNKNLYIQSIADDSLLLINYLWMKNVDTLHPLSDLVFVPQDYDGNNRAWRIFIKDPTGEVNGIKLGGEVWSRVKEYKAEAVKEMAHTPDQLRRFEGVYHSQNDSNNLIQFIVIGNDLVLKDNQDTHLVPESELSFYKPDNLWFSVDFSKDAAGNIISALVVKRDVWTKNPKPVITEAQLHAFEGKYQAKNDSDNCIQLIAHGRQLVVKQLWNGKSIIVTPLTDLYFYNRDLSYSLQFVRDRDGKVRQAWLFNTTEFDRKIPD